MVSVETKFFISFLWTFQLSVKTTNLANNVSERDITTCSCVCVHSVGNSPVQSDSVKIKCTTGVISLARHCSNLPGIKENTIFRNM